MLTNTSSVTLASVIAPAAAGDGVSSECFAKNEGYDIFRFALIVYFGTPIALFGIISNAILIKCFASRKRIESPTLYLFALAIVDFLICCIYLPFFTVDALAIYFEHPLLYQFWHSYAMLLYGSSRVFQFASTYFVVCATFERFVVVANLKSLKALSTSRGRFSVVASTMAMVLLLRLPAFFDYQIEHNSLCPVFQSFTFVPLLMAYEKYQLFNFYVICFLHILLPFILLLLLNLSIITLTKKKVYQRLAPRRRRGEFGDMPQISMLLRKESFMSNHAHRSELRFATRTMVMITFTYLFCNMFNVIVTVMENAFKGKRLMFEEDGSSTKFYTYSADLVSIAVTINCFARIFVYFFCNPQFRCQLVGYAKGCLHAHPTEKSSTTFCHHHHNPSANVSTETRYRSKPYSQNTAEFAQSENCNRPITTAAAEISPTTTTSDSPPSSPLSLSAPLKNLPSAATLVSAPLAIYAARRALPPVIKPSFASFIHHSDDFRPLIVSPTLLSLPTVLRDSRYADDFAARDGDAGYETINSSKSTLYV